MIELRFTEKYQYNKNCSIQVKIDPKILCTVYWYAYLSFHVSLATCLYQIEFNYGSSKKLSHIKSISDPLLVFRMKTYLC